MQANFWARTIAIAGLCLGALGCSPVAQSGMNMNLLGMPANVTNISELSGRSRPGTTVYVRGKVVQQVPLLDARVYSIEDETGQIKVWTRDTMPPLGEEVTVRGKLQFQSIPVEGQEVGEVYVEEVERLKNE